MSISDFLYYKNLLIKNKYKEVVNGRRPNWNTVVVPSNDYHQFIYQNMAFIWFLLSNRTY